MINGRPLIAIVTARASESEQKSMLDGILKQAEKYGLCTIVISNIYNFSEYYAEVEIENKIYELIGSERIDGILLMAESLLEKDLDRYIFETLPKLSIPIVIAGKDIEGYTCVNNDVRSDFRDITRHLTEEHGFTDFDVLTGKAEFQTSFDRVDGIRDVLREKGIELKEENVIFGDYWTTSGAALAHEYISGRRRIPQAVICTNDYMAFGLVDKLFEYDFKLPDMMTVTGYEFVGERYFHFPILTTYYRNRSAVGRKAVSILNSMITGAPVEDISPSGCMVTGDTCPCGTDGKYLKSEINTVRTEKFYNTLSMGGNFEQQLGMCRSIEDYVAALHNFSYLLRNVSGIYLCLYENWCSDKEKSDLKVSSNEEIMTMYRVMSPENGTDAPLYFTRKMLYPDELPGAGDAQILYFLPMFSSGIDMGYFILQYSEPDGYDPIAVDWIKTAANSLNVLKMKNDITELLEYNNLSAFHDTATGIYNRAGFVREIENALNRKKAGTKISVFMFKTRIFTDESRIDEKRTSVKIDSEIAECMKKFAEKKSAFCARLPDKQFIFAAVGELPQNYHEEIEDRLMVMITHSPTYSAARDTDTIISAGITIPAEDVTADELFHYLSEEINRKTAEFYDRRKSLGFSEFSNIRMTMHRSPDKKWDVEDVCRDLHLSCGHFRAAYKNMFGVSFHRDLIQSRVGLAKYLLITTTLSLQVIASKCGYDDDKYFLRQFKQFTGISPNSYRKNSAVVKQ